MNDAANNRWIPSPELLAAFADGELDGREDAAQTRAAVETWLARNPRAQAEVDAVRRLKDLFDRTRPPHPSTETWQALLDRIESRPAPLAKPRPSATGWFVGVGAAAACLLWIGLLASSFLRSPRVSDEVFAVAADDEVEILHVEGNAIDSLVVGMLPLRGVLELADPGEVSITSVSPARRDNMIPTVHLEGPRRPMIWAKLEGEGE